MAVNKMVVDEMVVDEMEVDELVFDEMVVDEIYFYELTLSRVHEAWHWIDVSNYRLFMHINADQVLQKYAILFFPNLLNFVSKMIFV